MSTKHPVPFRIEHALRERLLGAGRHEVAQAIGWDDSQASRFLSGQMGVVIDKLEISNRVRKRVQGMLHKRVKERPGIYF